MTGYARRNLKLMYILSFLSSMRGYEGVVIVFYASVSGSFTLGMMAWAMVYLSSSVFEVPTGVLSDRIGRRTTLIFYFASYFFATLCLYLAHGPALLFVASALMGLGMALKSGTSSAYIYENLELLGQREAFNRNEGLRQAFGRYALVVSGIVGTALIFFFDIRAAILVTALPMGAALLLSFWLRDVRPNAPLSSNVFSGVASAWNRFRADVVLRNISIGRMVAVGAGNAEYRFRSLFFVTIVPEWFVNMLGLINNLISGVFMQYVHVIVRTIGVRRSLVHAELFDSMSVVILSLIGSAWSTVAMSSISSAVFGVRQIASEHILQQRYSNDERATMGSLVGLGGSILYGTLAIVSGVVADAIGVLYTLLLFQVLLLLVPLFFYLGTRAPSQHTVH